MRTDEQRAKQRQAYYRNREKRLEYMRQYNQKRANEDPEYYDKKNSQIHFRKMKKAIDAMMEKGKPVDDSIR